MDVRCTQAYTQAHTRRHNKLKCMTSDLWGSCYHSPWGHRQLKRQWLSAAWDRRCRQKSHWSFLCININTCLESDIHQLLPWLTPAAPVRFSQKMLPKPLSDSEKRKSPFHNNAPIYTVLLHDWDVIECCVCCLNRRNLYAWFFKWLWFCCHFKQLKFSVLVTAHKTLTINTSHVLSDYVTVISDTGRPRLSVSSLGNKPSASPVWTHWSPGLILRTISGRCCACAVDAAQRSDDLAGPWRSETWGAGETQSQIHTSSDHSCEDWGWLTQRSLGSQHSTYSIKMCHT